MVQKNASDKPSRKDYLRQYRQAHPDKVIHWQLTSYANALLNAGYTIIDPDGNAVKTKEKER